jgi:hypothetical protein
VEAAEQARVLRVWGVHVLGLDVELVGVDLGLGFGVASSDLAGVGMDGGLRGRPGAVEDRQRWWLKESGVGRWCLRRQPRGRRQTVRPAAEAGASARRKNGGCRRKEEERQGGR